MRFDLLKPAAKERRCCENANEAVSPLIVVDRPALPCLPYPSRPVQTAQLSPLEAGLVWSQSLIQSENILHAEIKDGHDER